MRLDYSFNIYRRLHVSEINTKSLDSGCFVTRFYSIPAKPTHPKLCHPNKYCKISLYG